MMRKCKLAKWEKKIILIIQMITVENEKLKIDVPIEDDIENKIKND